MGYRVITKNLESHLFISEGHPWGIRYSLSSLKRPTRAFGTSPVFIHTAPALQCKTLHKVTLNQTWPSELGHHATPLHVLSSPVCKLRMFSYTIHESFLAVTWEKTLLAAISSNRSVTGFAERRSNVHHWFILSWFFFLRFETRVQIKGLLLIAKIHSNYQTSSIVLRGTDNMSEFWKPNRLQKTLRQQFLGEEGARSQVLLAQK